MSEQSHVYVRSVGGSFDKEVGVLVTFSTNCDTIRTLANYVQYVIVSFLIIYIDYTHTHV